MFSVRATSLVPGFKRRIETALISGEIKERTGKVENNNFKVSANHQILLERSRKGTIMIERREMCTAHSLR